MNGFQGYRATTRRQLTFPIKSPEVPGLDVTLMVLVLLRWS